MSSRADAWSLARALVVDDKLSYAEVAEKTGLPLSTIQKRASRESWKAAAETGVDYSARVKALKSKALDLALTSEDPQVFFAWQALEKTWPEHRYGSKVKSLGEQRELVVTFMEALIQYLVENDRVALTAMQPHIQPFAKVLEAQWAK
jgi:hypothetical protein